MVIHPKAELCELLIADFRPRTSLSAELVQGSLHFRDDFIAGGDFLIACREVLFVPDLEIVEMRIGRILGRDALFPRGLPHEIVSTQKHGHYAAFFPRNKVEYRQRFRRQNPKSQPLQNVLRRFQDDLGDLFAGWVWVQRDFSRGHAHA